ncbi:sigma-70 family RNA polymerase sigma factor [Streptomyces sp. NPDC055210]
MSWTFFGMEGRSDVGENDSTDAYQHLVLALHSYVSRLLGGDHFRAEDIVQESLLRCWRIYDSVGCDLLRPWLFRVARNLAIDSYRKESRLPLDTGKPLWLDDGPVEHDGSETVVTSIVVRDAMNSLPIGQREAIYETYFMGSTLEEAAGKLGLPVGTVKSRVHYGIRAMRLSIREHTAHEAA